MSHHWQAKKWTKKCCLFCSVWLLLPIVSGCHQTKNADLETVVQVIDELPKNYTVNEYRQAVSQYSFIVRRMNQKQILNEVKKVTIKLDQVVQNLKTFLSKELHWLKKYEENWNEFKETSFKKFHQILAGEVSKDFYLNDEEFIQISYDLAEQNLSSNKIPWSLFAVNLASVLFSAVKTEFFIHKLLILCNQFIRKSVSDLNQWKRSEKRAIFNLAFDLNYWIKWYEIQGVITLHGPRFAWSLVNLFFLQREITRFRQRFVERDDSTKLLFRKWLLYSEEFATQQSQNWQSTNCFAVPFFFLRGEVSIHPVDQKS